MRSIHTKAFVLCSWLMAVVMACALVTPAHARTLVLPGHHIAIQAACKTPPCQTLPPVPNPKLTVEHAAADGALTRTEAFSIAILQGATELFPVSSLGHAVVVPHLVGWHIDQHRADFLPFLVVLHMGTAAALLLYFWKDWWLIFIGLIGVGTADECATYRRVFGLIVVATIPAVIFGFALEKPLRHLFGSPTVAAAFLIVNGFILFFGERLRRARQLAGQTLVENVTTSTTDTLAHMPWRDALVIGLWQSLALIPGISRSGATMVGGLLRNLTHEAAAHFSFLIATPVITGAAVLEIPKLLKAAHQNPTAGAAFGGFTHLYVQAGVLAGVVAFLSTWFLMRYFKMRDFQALNPFAYYCWALGVVALLLLS